MFDASPSTILYCIAVDGPQLHRRVNWMLFFRF
ncbi:hypothetical protein V6Z11_A07G207500 [Gossypium hirsutum]